MNINHYLIDCKNTQPHHKYGNNCLSCFEWISLPCYMSNSCGMYRDNMYELPSHMRQKAVDMISTEKGNELQCLETGTTTLMGAVHYGLPYWCAFLIIKCQVDIYTRNKRGETALDIAQDRRNSFYKLGLSASVAQYDKIIEFLQESIKAEKIIHDVKKLKPFDIGILIYNYLSPILLWPDWAIIDPLVGY
jgi:hypothetical protein